MAPFSESLTVLSLAHFDTFDSRAPLPFVRPMNQSTAGPLVLKLNFEKVAFIGHGS